MVAGTKVKLDSSGSRPIGNQEKKRNGKRNGKNNEKIHNRSKPRISCAALNHCARFKDHEQWLGEAWTADHDQRPAGKSAKPRDPRIRRQAPSDKRQALDTIE